MSSPICLSLIILYLLSLSSINRFPFPFVAVLGLRAPKANRSALAQINDILNEEAKSFALVQNDFAALPEVRRDPNSIRNKDELNVNRPDEYFNGDIDLSPEQANQIVENIKEDRRIGRTPVFQTWPRGQSISFDFSDSIGPRIRRLIRTAMLLWQKYTCIRFEEGGPNVDRLEFFDGGGCSSFVGKVGGTQAKQARPDQLRHIAINYDNIPIGKWNNFQSIGRLQADTLGLPYDTGINTVYNCNEHCSNQILCQRNGYQNPNSCYECLCPEPFAGSTNCQDILPSNSDCGGTIFVGQEPVMIQSPGYPIRYPNDVECNWLIMAPKGGRVHLEFIDSFEFSCEDTCVSAYVEVKYHNDKRLTGARLCCSSLPKHKFISFNREMAVIMKGREGAYRGFLAKVYSDVDIEKPYPSPSTVIPTIFTTPIPSPSPSFVTPILRPSPPISPPSFVVPQWKFSTVQPQPLPQATRKQVWQTTQPLPRPQWTTTQKPAVRYSTTASPMWTFPRFTTTTTIASHEIISVDGDCTCGPWSNWEGECTQKCGGCGRNTRRRICDKKECRTVDKQICNVDACPHGVNFLINNGEFHILWRGCCVGLFRSETNVCSALETNENPFLKFLSSLITSKDTSGSATDQEKRIRNRLRED
ncbi:hypothetical protein WR25_09174 [Diploscapter pachys]|uniref:Metalloendopeptidase n=1 Tax=Diploscapter pachys TaxID=2018661 RepID=A0A2A2LWL6_9BILA|nr:hypothetical protein WR25_09174 [Diploscapter pachys]